MEVLIQLFSNRILFAGMIPWALAQIIKVPLEFIMTRRWNWALLLSAGGMPSSHSALVTGVATGIGMTSGFDSPVFAVAFTFAAITIYDAIGVRRHAGDHARVLNLMIDELFTGHPLAEKELKEMLGHTPRQVLAGIGLGIIAAVLVMNQ